ncbi:MAG: CotH kinase family protein [Sedimentisphaerales bacterium]|nr:CotH kinase family protein [Sedimentisphaerales bacterium]
MIKKILSMFLVSVFLLVTVQSIYAQPGGFGGRGGMGGMPGGMGGMRGGMGGGMNQKASYVSEFDKDENGWLNNEERKAARESMGNRQSMGGRGMMGRGGRGGGFGGTSYTEGIALTPADVKSYFKKESLYDLETLRTIFLEFENDDWEAELEAFYRSDVEVPAKMIVDGKEYKNVGVRFRGNTSYQMVGTGGKRPLNLSVDYIKNKQELYSYRTLNLMNCNTDPTFMRQVLYHYIAGQYIHALKANYIRLVINDENWGIYVNLQQFNKDFIRDEFNTTKGARWKIPQMSPNGGLVYVGDNIESYKRTYEIKSKDDPNSWKALVNLCKVLNETPAEKLENAIRPILDIDGALKFLALEKSLVNSDGYWTRASDYLLYMDPTGRFHVFPYDTSETLSEAEGGPGGGRGGRGGFGMGGGTSSGTMLDPLAGANDYDKPLLSKLLAVPSLKQRYYGYIRDIAENWMDWNKIEPLVEQYKLLIAEDIEIDTKKNSTTEAFYSGIDGSEQETFNLVGFGGGRGGRGGPGRGSSISLKDFFEKRRAELLNLQEISQAK